MAAAGFTQQAMTRGSREVRCALETEALQRLVSEGGDEDFVTSWLIGDRERARVGVSCGLEDLCKE